MQYLILKIMSLFLPAPVSVSASVPTSDPGNDPGYNPAPRSPGSDFPANLIKYEKPGPENNTFIPNTCYN